MEKVFADIIEETGITVKDVADLISVLLKYK
jgi:hypothetical protein